MTKTLDRIIDIIHEAEREERARIRIHDIVAEELKRWEGKKLTARIKTDLAKLHPDWTIYYEPAAEYGSAYLYVWGGDSGFDKYDSRIMIHLGYYKDVQEVSVARFEYTDNCNGGAARERNSKRLNILREGNRIKRIQQAIDQLTQAKFNLAAAMPDSIEFPDIYSVEKAFGIKD